MEPDFDPYKRRAFPRAALPAHFYGSREMTGARGDSIEIENIAGPSQEYDREFRNGQHQPHGKITSLHRPIKSRTYCESYVPMAAFESHAHKIVEKMEEDETLMEDTPMSEQLRKETLRELPQCLTVKRCVKAKLSKSVSQKSRKRPLSCYTALKYKIRIKLSNLKLKIVDNLNYLELWYSTLKKIEGHFGSSYASYFKFLRWLFVLNVFLTIPAIAFIIVPQITFDLAQDNPETSSSFQFQDIFTGAGFFLNTTLYYGHYTDETIVLIDNLYYNMPVAYFSVMVLLYLISFIFLSISVALSYRRSFIETEGGGKNVFANKIFCGWDFGIATKRAAELKSGAIYIELKELLSESLRFKRKTSLMEKFWTFTIQMIVNFIIIILLGAVGYGLWLLLEEYKDNSSPIPSVISNILIMVLPVMFKFIAKYEDYQNPSTVLYITLIRTYLLGLVLVGVTSAYFLIRDSNCWETHLGQEIYRFMIYDFIFSVIFSTIIDIGWYFILRLRKNNQGTEFNVARHTLQIIYNQGLFLVGFLYSPFLSVIVILKMFIIWYIRDFTVTKLCSPLAKTWRAAQTTTYFLMMTFITTTLITALHGYSITTINTSETCGPFQNYNYTYEVIVGTETSQNVFRDIVIYLTKPWVVTLILVALAIAVYYVKAQAEAQREKVKMLRDLLIWEGKDKEFLLQHIANSTRGRFVFHKNGRMDPTQLTPKENHNLENHRDSFAPSIFSGDVDILYNYKKYS